MSPEILSLCMFGLACLALLAGFPVAFTLAGVGLGTAGVAWAFGIFDFSFLSAVPMRIFGTAIWNEVLLAVPLFVFMGVTLERSRVAEELLDTMGQLFGAMRGGLGVSVFIVGALMAASTGIVGATVVTMGLISMPTMLRRGYDPRLASGIICASGTLGQIIPPSIVLIVLGDQISNAYVDAQREIGNWSPEPVSVADLFAGALIPGLCLVGLYILYQLIIAIILPHSSPSIPRDDFTHREGSFAAQAINALLPPIILIVAVLGSILIGVATPTEAAGVGAIGAILLACEKTDGVSRTPVYIGGGCVALVLVMANIFDLRLNMEVTSALNIAAIVVAMIACAGVAWSVLYSTRVLLRTGILIEVMQSTMKISSLVFVILIGATIFSLVFRGLGGDDIVHEFLSNLPGGIYTAIFLVMALVFVLGFFLDFLEITLVVVPLVAPTLLQSDINPIWLGVMLAMNLQTSFLTPPFGFALFYLRGVAPETVRTSQIYIGIIPFVLIQLLMLGILALFPALATWLPATIYGTTFQ
jgi:TRAP-type mannitol/chloroaromatic compound transport system permease large subunit